MQKLMVSIKNKDGVAEMKEVTVLRSWATASGATLFLHAGSGVYGHLDGAPVQSEADLDIIENPAQREAAKKWWKFTGKDLAETYYSAKAAAEKARLGDFQASGKTPETELDYVMYQSRNISGNDIVSEWSKPVSWVERFAVRPDWWGQASGISFKGVEYRRHEEQGVFVDPEKPATKTSSVKIKAAEI